jgi:flagellar biosynthetic protein FlhB
MPDVGEKTEAPTPRRRQETREEGNVARSQDLTAALMLLGAVLLLGAFGRFMFGNMRTMVEGSLGGRWSEDVALTGDVGQRVGALLSIGGRIAAPVAVGAVVLAVVASLLQVGFLITGKPLVPKLSKLSPLKGIQQIFGARGAMRLVMSLGKVVVVAVVAAIVIYLDLPKVMALIHLEPAQALAASAGLVYWLAIWIAVVLLLLALLDYAYQKWQHEQDMKMSKQEVKEEFKRMEGDPLVKQRRAKVARQLAMQRINQAVPQADVVVTNPTHFAVALKYDGEKMHAPKVTAKGADFLALRIRQIAAANGVPIVERKELARALYRTVEVGQEIPPDHYAAVAEILAYVYRLSGRRSA